MKVFVPVEICVEENGVLGRLPFAVDYNCRSRTEEEVIQNMEKDLGALIQAEKSIRHFLFFLSFREKWRGDWLAVDFFSKKEHILFSFLFSALTALCYAFFFVPLLWILSFFYPDLALPFHAQTSGPILHFCEQITPLAASLGALFWLVCYSYLYEPLIFIYADLLLMSKFFCSLHKTIFFLFLPPKSSITLENFHA